MTDLLAVSAPMIPQGRDFVALEGEIALALGIVGVLLAPFFSVRRSNLVSGGIALLAIVVAFVLTLRPKPESGFAFRELLLLDPASLFWEQVLLIFMAGVVLLWFVTTRRALKEGDGPEFFTLLLASTAGMMLMGQTTNLLLIVLATEIASMPSYILAGFRKTRRNAAEGALKFVLFGAVCTAIMIYGCSLLYGTHGSLSVDAIAASIKAAGTVPLTTVIGLIAVFAGLLFKISGFPLHFWAPDVLEGTYADVAVFLSVASKSAGIVLLARLATVLAPAHEGLQHGMGIAIAAVSVASMIVGNLGAQQQTSVKRMLAYSSIAHAGYMMGAVALLMPMHITEAMTVLGIYLAIYLFMQLGAFAVVGEVETATGSDRIEAFRGLSILSPLSAAALAVAMLSMIGIPPFGGFWAKLKVMLLLAQVGGWWWVVVLSIAINSIISVGFYGRVLRAMYLEKAPDPPARYALPTGLIGLACAIALLATFIFLAPLESTSTRLADQHRAAAPAK